MPDRIEMRVKRAKEDIQNALRDVEAALTDALGAATQVVKNKVMDLTPRWKGGLMKSIKAEAKGREGRVFGDGIVMKVMENNPHATWSKMPPHQPIKDWVEGKLGITGKNGDAVAWAIGQKIKKSGLTIPNKEGRGEMFAKTLQLVQSTKFHWAAFMSRLRQLERRRS